MASVRELDVDLSAPPERRWDSLVHWKAAARDLLAFYVRDLGGLESFAPFLREYCDTFLDAEYMAELRGIARVLDAPEEEVALANLYYDAIKLVLQGGLACTAFAVDTGGGPLHARNLDWLTASGALATESLIVNFHRGRGAPLYRTVGWPGFAGCLSGVAPGRFAVSLNAVSSEDAPGLAPPISFVLRRVLETANTFDEAVVALRTTSVASDSLLLVSGVAAGQMVVIERAPTRAALRFPTGGAVFVTNDYRALAAKGAVRTNLAETSGGRYERAQTLVRHHPPQDAEACFAVLYDSQVKMGVTVQHIVFSAARGEVTVRLPT